MENLFLKHADFFESKACNKIKGLEGLNSIRPDLSEKEVVNKTSVFKGVAQQFLKGGATLKNLFDTSEIIEDVSEIKELIEDVCDSLITNDLDDAIKEEKKSLTQGISRYLRWEDSTGRRDDEQWTIFFDQQLIVDQKFFPLLEEIIPQVKGTPGIQVFFDVIFKNDVTKEIQGVKYKGGIPWLSSAATAKMKAEDDKWMNVMLKSLDTLVPEGETYKVSASYYHLQPKTRIVGWELSSFDSCGSIVTLEETFCNSDEFKSIKTAQDEIIKEAFESFLEGTECSGENCKNCILNCSCNFIKTPEEMELKEVKKGKRPQPSPDQQKIIDWEEGALSVIAGAGAGKTECSSEHMKKLILKEASEYAAEHKTSIEESVHSVLPWFFMTTFTNAGVNEMKERMIGKFEIEGIQIDANELNIMTFNTFAYNIDREFFEELGFSKEPSVIDDIRNTKIIINLINENKISGISSENAIVDTPNCRGLLSIVKKCFDLIKAENVTTEQELMILLGNTYRKMITSDTAFSDILDLYQIYQDELLKEGFITFADQEPMALSLLNKHPEYLETLGYKHIVVDEFQDSNDIQMEFVKRLCSTTTYKSLVVVGDDFQAIYGFRNTSPENMINFQKKFGKDVTQHYLVDNYRSVPEIIGISNLFIKNNENQIPKDLVAFRKSEGKKVVVRGFYDKDEEDDAILSIVKKKLEEGYLPEDICIITGTNDEITRIGAKLADANIPIVMKNPQKYSQNSRVKAAIKLANAIWDPNTTENYFPYLVAKYNGDLVKEYTPEEIMEMISDVQMKFKGFENLEYGYQRKIFHDLLEEIKGNDEIFQSFINMLTVCEDFPSELDFIQDFKKYGYQSAVRMDQMYQGVVLVTAHSSKGLEWPVVINTLDGYDSSIFHGYNKKSEFVKKEIEEKRRLVYVSMTRARNELFIVGKYNISEETVTKGIVVPAVENMFLKEVFDIIDPQAYIPVDVNKDAKKAMKKALAEEAKAERERRKIARQSQAILAKYRGDKKAMEKALAEKKPKKKSRTLSDLEKLEYNELTKNSKQTDLSDWLTRI